MFHTEAESASVESKSSNKALQPLIQTTVLTSNLNSPVSLAKILLL